MTAPTLADSDARFAAYRADIRRGRANAARHIEALRGQAKRSKCGGERERLETLAGDLEVQLRRADTGL